MLLWNMRAVSSCTVGISGPFSGISSMDMIYSTAAQEKLRAKASEG
jgi:hypothetical protein